MVEINNKISQLNLENVGFIQKSAVGSHSYTIEETKTMSYINKELLKKQVRGENLELKNDNKTRYFLVEDGTIFKYNTETLLFYQLNLKTMKWYINQSLTSLYYDTYLKIQELIDFKDYYDIEDQVDRNNGRHL